MSWVRVPLVTQRKRNFNYEVSLFLVSVIRPHSLNRINLVQSFYPKTQSGIMLISHQKKQECLKTTWRTMKNDMKQRKTNQSTNSTKLSWKRLPWHRPGIGKGQKEKCQPHDVHTISTSTSRDPGGILTLDLQNRNLTLYTAKLRSLEKRMQS